MQNHSDAIAEVQQAENVIASIPRLAEIDSVSVRLGTSWSGDPALDLTFYLRENTVVDDAFAARFVDYSSAVRDLILRTGISRFPYSHVAKAA